MDDVQKEIRNMTYGKAFAILRDLGKPDTPDELKGAAIRKVILDMETHNAVTKDVMVNVIRYLFSLCFEELEGRASEDAKISYTPANDLLPLEELLRMEGEPVWIERHDGCPSRWVLIEAVTKTFLHTYGCGVLEWEELGKTWWAYRRKPEG